MSFGTRLARTQETGPQAAEFADLVGPRSKRAFTKTPARAARDYPPAGRGGVDIVYVLTGGERRDCLKEGPSSSVGLSFAAAEMQCARGPARSLAPNSPARTARHAPRPQTTIGRETRSAESEALRKGAAAFNETHSVARSGERLALPFAGITPRLIWSSRSFEQRLKLPSPSPHCLALYTRRNRADHVLGISQQQPLAVLGEPRSDAALAHRLTRGLAERAGRSCLIGVGAILKADAVGAQGIDLVKMSSVTKARC